ncbi:putative TM2 domain [Monocercomonoides exilis]|uniref:putative TM2 domain n=1 Tax=Monocercomonoides exilis TaxID=2049356 RepID=UPI00355A66AE|nr:putative TM2 domain [Monocercomonoides exilis]|eukprot:MONOS_926.1-p1 / transcript=MONOS_926.1 / gene=MONOS_926 / organism=Monocercomonoides_exilis_PA203 / gene_product=unspecified product / transcript_product=unspecified product / location=Mono_scaffold00015:158211-158748(-) / protein_length=160 / sequence_SO=supercontig / SO=protein_coding / is_pseudo=false
MAQQYQTTAYPGQPQLMGGQTSLNLTDPRTFQDVVWSHSIAATVKMGVPAWGSGQFSSSTACLAWAACFLGFAGMHRVYLGDTMMGIVYCLTGGLCGVGQLIDGCSLSQTVESRNAEIRSVAQERANFLAQQSAAVAYQIGQPVTMPQSGYQTGAAYGQP